MTCVRRRSHARCRRRPLRESWMLLQANAYPEASTFVPIAHPARSRCGCRRRLTDAVQCFPASNVIQGANPRYRLCVPPCRALISPKSHLNGTTLSVPGNKLHDLHATVPTINQPLLAQLPWADGDQPGGPGVPQGRLCPPGAGGSIRERTTQATVRWAHSALYGCVSTGSPSS